MEIRILNREDAAEYKRIRLESLQRHPEAYGSSHEEESAESFDFFADRVAPSDCALTAGAFERGRLMAVASFFREDRPKLFHKGFVVGVYVSEAHRGKGIGKKLVAHLVANVEKLKGIAKLQLRVNSDNESAKRVYAACGFAKEGFERDAIRIGGKPYDEDIMVCYLGR